MRMIHLNSWKPRNPCVPQSGTRAKKQYVCVCLRLENSWFSVWLHGWFFFCLAPLTLSPMLYALCCERSEPSATYPPNKFNFCNIYYIFLLKLVNYFWYSSHKKSTKTDRLTAWVSTARFWTSIQAWSIEADQRSSCLSLFPDSN
jgi:hypothetical protein